MFVKNTHEPIIDMNTWEKAVSIRENRSRACKEHGEKHKYSGVIKCDCCVKETLKGNVYVKKMKKFIALNTKLKLANLMQIVKIQKQLELMF